MITAEPVKGVAFCTGCGLEKEQTYGEWIGGYHDHYVNYHGDKPCDCDDDYWCPGSRWCGEFNWREATA